MAQTSTPQPQDEYQPPEPSLQMRKLDPLVGTWRLIGRTLDADQDNVSGRVEIAWLPGGFFLELRGEINFMGDRVQSLEIVGYDPASQVFKATVFSNMDGAPATYFWDVQGSTVTHWTTGSKYTGTLSDDGRILAGGWRPDRGSEGQDSPAYDATMIREDT